MHVRQLCVKEHLLTRTEGYFGGFLPPQRPWCLELRKVKADTHTTHWKPHSSDSPASWAKNTLPSRTLRVLGFMLPPWIFPLQRIPPKIEKVTMLKKKKPPKKSKVIHADRLNHSWQCVQLFLVRDAEERCASNGRILSCVSYPKCRGVYPAEQCGAHASAARLQVELDSSDR